MGFRFSLSLAILLMGSLGCQGLAQDLQQEQFGIDGTESDSAFVYSYLDAADEARSQGKVSRLRDILGEARRVADSLGNPGLLQVVKKDLGEYYLETSSYDSAQVVLERAAKRYSDKKLQPQILNILATAYRYQSKYPEAMNTYNQGLALVDSLESPDIFAAINTNKASIYENLGNLSEAISLYQKGISFAEAVGDSSFLATALNNLGNLYYEQSNYKDAKTYLNEAISVGEEQEFYNTLLRAKHNLASTERDLGNYDKARNLYRKAWELHEKIRPDSPAIQLVYNMGRLHLAVSELHEAEEHFRESLEYSQKGGVPAGLFYNFIGLGDVALARENFSASINFYNDGFEIARKVDSPPFRIIVSEKLYEVYKKEGDFEQALRYHELAKQVSDSLTEAQQDEQLALAESELGLRQQQRINQLLEERQQQQEARINTQNWLIGVSALVIVIILVAIYVLYRTNKERKSANQELAELNEVKDKMMAVIAHDLRSPMASMQGVLYLLKDGNISMNDVRKVASELEVTINQNINMMDNLLNWTQSQMKGLETNINIFSAHDIAADALDSCQLQARHKSITLENKIPKNIDIKADPNLLKLIIRNLVNNAIKFSNEGDTVIVDATIEGDAAVLKVKDTGIGIPEEEQEQIFSVAGDSRSGTQNEKGSGLGLQLCKEFTEKQNGAIHLESTEGEGTVFYINLPKGDN